MRRPTFRRTLRLESLESREVLSAGGPSAQAQYMLEMVNLARTNPQAAAQRFTSNLVPTQNSKVGPLVVTQDFATKAGSKAELLGVAYNDKNGNGQYDQGEGQGNVEVDATNNATGQTVSTATWDNGGGYQLALDPGR